MRLRPPSPNRSEELDPVAVDMRMVFVIGTLAWLVAGLVVTVLVAVGALEDALWVAVCAAGVIIGAGGWLWARWRRR